MNNRFYVKVLLSLVIFVVSIVVYYYPVYQKGYAPGADHQNLIMARNFAVAGTYKIENSTGVFLASKNAEQFGVEKGIFNPLTTMIYGQLFKFFGFNENLPFYVAIILFSIFNVLVFILATQLLGVIVGFLSGISVALMPVMTVGAIHGGFYEWAMLFFGIALWLYLGSKHGSFRAGTARILMASVFFSLASLARNAFAISFVPLFFYDFFIHRSYKRSLIFLLPFIVLFGSTLTPYSWLGVPNNYYANIEQQSFDLVGHFFQDPYSYHYDKDNYTKEMFEKGLNRVGVLFATQWGYEVSFFERVSAYWDSFSFYIGQIISFTSMGGPFILGLMLLGLTRLYGLNKKLLGLLTFWFFVWLGYLVYDKTGNWDHLMEVVFIFAILTGLGLHYLIEILSGEGILKRIVSFVIVTTLFIGHLAYANKWKLHDIYRSSKEEVVLSLRNKLNSQNDVGGVYAIGIHPSSVYSLNYHIDHDMVYFDHKTIEKLIFQKRLKDAFTTYNISFVAGYSKELTDKIKSQVSVQSLP